MSKYKQNYFDGCCFCHPERSPNWRAERIPLNVDCKVKAEGILRSVPPLRMTIRCYLLLPYLVPLTEETEETEFLNRSKEPA